MCTISLDINENCKNLFRCEVIMPRRTRIYMDDDNGVAVVMAM